MKREMVTMLHYDAVYNPTLSQQGLSAGKKAPSQKAVVNQAQHLAYLEQHHYKKYDEYDLEQVRYLAVNSTKTNFDCSGGQQCNHFLVHIRP